MSADRAYSNWLASLQELTRTPDQAQAFQERRYAFAYRLRTELLRDQRLSTGPLLYGVQLEPAGWIYVGQTVNGRRRLRDLPVGESHHLANTFPPELWYRVSVLRWPLLAADLVVELPETGLALERLLQQHVRPLFNARRRGRGGGWLAVNFDIGAERARLAPSMEVLWPRVRSVWDELAACSEREPI
jgi:hypothetical protein